MHDSLADLQALYAQQGDQQYGGEAVSQLEHALQSAWFAEQDGAPDSLVIAALLHDVGHLLAGQHDDDIAHGIDDRHEAVAIPALKPLFAEDVLAPIALHVAAKRYLCAVQPDYFASLSLASRQSLALQGGPMNAAEAARFAASPYAQAAIALRTYDDRAKIENLATPTLDHYFSRARAISLSARAPGQEPV